MATSPPPALDISPRQAVRRLESELGLSRRDLAAALATDLRTIERWSGDQTYPQRAPRRRLAELLRLSDRLADTFEDAETVRRWMRRPNRYLRGMTPAEVVRAGRVDRADAALEALDSGVFL